MQGFGAWSSTVSQQWFTLLYPTGVVADDRGRDVASLYMVRILVLSLGAIAWIAMILVTGIFSVAPLIVIGIAVGSAHRFLPFKFHRAHLPSAMYITLFGGLLANVLAGLAEFSSNMGVSYISVLAARSIPEELPMLGNAFVEAFRIQDAFYYLAAAVIVIWCALHHRKT